MSVSVYGHVSCQSMVMSHVSVSRWSRLMSVYGHVSCQCKSMVTSHVSRWSCLMSVSVDGHISCQSMVMSHVSLWSSMATSHVSRWSCLMSVSVYGHVSCQSMIMSHISRVGGRREQACSAAAAWLTHLCWPLAPQLCARGLSKHVVVCQHHHAVGVCDVCWPAWLQRRVCRCVALFCAGWLQGQD